MTGLTNLEDKVTKHRQTIMQQIINSDRIIELIGGIPDEYETSDQLIDVNFFDTEYIQGTQETAKVFVAFDMNIDYNSKNNTYKNADIYFFVSAHQDKETKRAKDGSLVCDGIVHELETIFNNKPILGIGNGKFIYNRAYKPADSYRGRILCLKIMDYNMGV